MHRYTVSTLAFFVSGSVLLIAALPAANAERTDSPQVIQTLDGKILAGDEVFDSWPQYVASDFFKEHGMRCGTSDHIAVGNAKAEPPTDCGYNLTNPDPIYDPSMVKYRIPVVVHVLQSTSGTGFISEAMVQSQIDILNEDFLATPGTNGEPGTDVQIEFFLADEDPNGNPTNGITYTTNNSWFNDSGNYWDTLAWDTNYYMNIYTNTAGGYLGYVPDLPQGYIAGSNEDRVVIAWASFGRNSPAGPPYNLGRTATHEVGHYLGLHHTFNSGCGSLAACYTSGDRICDTDPESSPTFGCNDSGSCGDPDPIHNYMNYTDDLCMNQFTPEQARRTRCSLEHYRPVLSSSCSDAGTLSLDRQGYICEDSMVLSVTDCGLNLDGNTAETVFVTVVSASEPGGESVLLTETSTTSGTFEGSIILSETDSSGVLLVGTGDALTATYIDANDGAGGVNIPVIAAALVDCLPPQISNVQASSTSGSRATITFDTTEPATGTVRYGTACATLTSQADSAGTATSIVVDLNGLSPETDYFYAVDAVDDSGNVASDDNGGACFTFSTPQATVYFTEQFGNDNDLDNLSVFFQAQASTDFYGRCAESITALPTDPTGGTPLGLADDGFSEITPSGGQTVSLYGTSYSTFFVGSNGYITFGSGDALYEESLAAHFSLPRISALFDDFNPAAGGTISYLEFGDRIAVTWLDVPEYSEVTLNTFQIEIFFNGDIRVSYLDVYANDGIAGLSEGLGLDPAFFETDLSVITACITDCNGNDVDDAEDITSGASQDVNGNSIPDECEADCNGNSIPDDWDIQMGTSSDCNTNLIPDECETDCNGNSVPDDCDIQIGTSSDCNANLIPDECDISSGASTDENSDGIPDECALTVSVIAEGCRYLAVTPESFGSATCTIKITAPGYSCLDKYVTADGSLSDSPVSLSPAAWSAVHVHGADIAPGVTYEFQADFGLGWLTDSGSGTTMAWGDATEPYNAIDFDDITAVVDCFRNLPTALPLERCDLAPADPDHVIDFDDISYAVEAFRGLTFPWPAPPNPCGP